MPFVCFATVNFYNEVNNPQHREAVEKQTLGATQDVLPFCRFAKHFGNGKMKAILS